MVIAPGHVGVALFHHSTAKYSIFVNGRCVKQTELANHARRYATAQAKQHGTPLIVVRERSKAWRNRGAH